MVLLDLLNVVRNNLNRFIVQLLQLHLFPVSLFLNLNYQIIEITFDLSFGVLVILIHLVQMCFKANLFPFELLRFCFEYL